MCIWKVDKENRMCNFCSYYGGCEARPLTDADRYIYAMSDVVGCDIRGKSRLRAMAWGRYIVAYRLSSEGATTSGIARVLGIDRTTVIYGVRQVETMLKYPNAYLYEYHLWKQFNEKT